MSHFISFAIRLLSSPWQWSREEKLPHAIWAAGRGLLAALLPSFDRVENIWLEPDNWQVGQTPATVEASYGTLTGPMIALFNEKRDKLGDRVRVSRVEYDIRP